MIINNGNVYKYLTDKMYFSGKQVAMAFYNGKLVYPEEEQNYNVSGTIDCGGQLGYPSNSNDQTHLGYDEWIINVNMGSSSFHSIQSFNSIEFVYGTIDTQNHSATEIYKADIVSGYTSVKNNNQWQLTSNNISVIKSTTDGQNPSVKIYDPLNLFCIGCTFTLKNNFINNGITIINTANI